MLLLLNESADGGCWHHKSDIITAVLAFVALLRTLPVKIGLERDVYKLLPSLTVTHTHTPVHAHTCTNTVQATRTTVGPDWFNHVGQSCGWRERLTAPYDVRPLGSCPAADKAPIPPGAQSKRPPERLGGNDKLPGRAFGSK